MKMRNTLITMALLAVASFAAISVNEAAAASRSAQDFVRNATSGNQFEILSSQMALEKSQDPNIQQFAKQMIDDHSKAGEQLKSTLPQSSVDPSVAGDTLESRHQKMLDKLRSASARDFDRQYIKAQQKAHKETVKLFKDYSQKGEDPALKEFASQTLPKLEQHREHVKELKANKS
jgi:putative membrane protein